MYYALVDFRNECDANLGLLYADTRETLAEQLIEQCNYSLDEDAMELIDSAEEEELDHDDIECELGGTLEDYLNLRDNPSRGKVQGFFMEYSGASVEVLAFSSVFSRISGAFNAFAKKTCTLSEWRMRPVPPPDPGQLDAELRSNEPSERFFDHIEE